MNKNWKIILAVTVAVILIVSLAWYFMVYQQEMETATRRQEWESTLVAGTTEVYASLDPLVGGAGFDSTIDQHIFERPYTIDTENSGKFLPLLLQSMPSIPSQDNGGNWYIDLKFRADIKFRDGTLLTAEDVVYSWDQNYAFDPVSHHFYDSISKIGPNGKRWEAIDNTTVRSWMRDSYYGTIAAFLQTPVGGIISKASLQPFVAGNRTGDPNTLMGTGPFYVESFVPNDELVLRAWTGYRADSVVPKPKINKLVLKMFKDPSSMRLALEQGEIDIALRNLFPSDIVSLATNPDIVTETKPTGYNRFLILNRRIPPMDDIRVRQAIAYCVNGTEIVERNLQGLGKASYSTLSDWQQGFDPIFREMYPLNVTKAKELLTEAGYPNGFTMTISYANRADVKESEEASMIILQSQLAKAGITVLLNYKEWASISADLAKDTIVQAFAGFYFSTDPDPDYMFTSGTMASGSLWARHSGINDTLVNQLCKQERALYDPSQVSSDRRAIIEELQGIYAEDVFGIPLFQAPQMAAYQSYVKGYHLYWTDYLRDFERAYKVAPPGMF